MSDTPIQHPTPAEAFKQAKAHATLLRSLYLHPKFKYAQPPTPVFIKPNMDETPPALFFVADFVQTTYIEYVIPFLPAGATRKCKDVANPWAYIDANYVWEWEWDEAAGVLKDKDGNVKEFPKLAQAQAVQKMGDIVSRGFMARKVILENATDLKAQLLMGGQPFDFGEEVEKAVRETYAF
ncbi:uncharacterized protein GGS22DRAFT_117420 [Annulohypoxylon maeteangense]|uniref:uncharacterized protein n=1 Tax=Annulohypoxylon maeteangense TaxID=1927788 RepID=UPI002007B243|nr:uncharacterized protein GGS22DRAFT_117420 [Annulohypoxylon maeteangense]KAI0886778.1 hypothetical protein GGS22DRAFT_117420 [Annulohypoxylon maeteangense]